MSVTASNLRIFEEMVLNIAQIYCIHSLFTTSQTIFLLLLNFFSVSLIPMCVIFVHFCSCVHLSVPSQFGAEFRRFSLDRSKPGRFDEFYGLLQHVHRIPNVELLVGYADVHGDLLPINNDDNYHKAISTASPLLRLFLQRKGKCRESVWTKSPSFHSLGRSAFLWNTK